MTSLSEAKLRIELIEIEKAAIEEDLHASNSELNTLRDSYGDVVAQLDAIKVEKAIIEEDLHASNSELNALRDSYGDVVAQLDAIKVEKAIIEEDLHSSSSELNELRISHDNVLNLNSQLSDDLLSMRQRFSPIADDIENAVKVVEGISELQHKLLQLKEDMTQMESEYLIGRNRYQELMMELATLEDRLELYSFGLYEPHFSFDASDAYRDALNKCYEERKLLVKEDRAATCNTTWTINGSKIEGRKSTRDFTKIMLRAFNGECDSALLKVRWNNVKSMEERIRKSFDAIGELGVTQHIELNNEYLHLRLKELWLTHEYQEKIHEEKEEQRRLREQMREEERSLREMEAARQEAEKEEFRYAKALNKARQEMQDAHIEEKSDLEIKISQLEKNLAEAVELKNRAISMAQITKAGYVYVISNIGSFGEDVFKIGMTRRLDPTDRVRELSGASVPFSFDIHAMIYSNNAPELENNFHRKFKYKRLNLVNGRKEFFNVSLQEIADYARELNHEVELTKLAEARDYRETKALKERMSNNLESLEGEVIDPRKFPANLFNDLEFQGESESTRIY